jgi:hypothetical protein
MQGSAREMLVLGLTVAAVIGVLGLLVIAPRHLFPRRDPRPIYRLVATSYVLLWGVVGGICVVRFGLPAAPVSAAVVAVILVSLALAVYQPLRADREKSKAIGRSARGMCRRCGYDLAGNVSGVCPECGSAR